MRIPSLDIGERIDTVQRELAEACLASRRAPDSVALLAVSKTRSADEVREAFACGLNHFGENFVQEAIAKIEELADVGIVWHYIGAIQSNKTRDLARHFQWVHTVDRRKIADRLSRARGESHPESPLDVCLQVNVDAEPQKAGIAIDELPGFIEHVAGLANLRVRGLMAIPATNDDPQAMRPSFATLARLFDDHRPIAGPNWDTLSMGMSGDFPIAVDEGATMVRIGTAIFGPRAPKPEQTPKAQTTNRHREPTA